MNTISLLESLRTGKVDDAFEAARRLSRSANPPVEEIIKVLNTAETVQNCEAAAYALSWMLRLSNNAPLKALIECVNNQDQNASVRGLALEGLGIHAPSQRNTLWRNIEKAVLRSLRDESPEIRFWACYAAGTLHIRKALPLLRKLASEDKAMCPSWWKVSDEAADAVERIHRRQHIPDRNRILEAAQH
jgi:hypothetical protein